MVGVVGCRGGLEEPGQLLEELLCWAGGGPGLLELEELFGRGVKGLLSPEGGQWSTMVGGRSTIVGGRSIMVGGRSTM